jgi:hypothetical protein
MLTLSKAQIAKAGTQCVCRPTEVVHCTLGFLRGLSHSLRFEQEGKALHDDGLREENSQRCE